MGLFGKKKRTEAAPVPAPAAASDDELIAVVTAAARAASDETLIAVIAAAVAAYEAEQYRQTLYIRKINRIAGTRPAWGLTGMQEAIDTRRM